MEKATAVCDWQLRARQEHDPIDAENRVAKMEERIRRRLKKNGPLTDRQLKRALHAYGRELGAWAYSAAHSNLAHIGEIAQDEKGRWQINPDF